jgi:hypothetical protein
MRRIFEALVDAFFFALLSFLDGLKARRGDDPWREKHRALKRMAAGSVAVTGVILLAGVLFASLLSGDHGPMLNGLTDPMRDFASLAFLALMALALSCIAWSAWALYRFETGEE